MIFMICVTQFAILGLGHCGLVVKTGLLTESDIIPYKHVHWLLFIFVVISCGLSTNSKDYDDDDDDDDVYFRDNKQMNKHCIHELRPLPSADPAAVAKIWVHLNSVARRAARFHKLHINNFNLLLSQTLASPATEQWSLHLHIYTNLAITIYI